MRRLIRFFGLLVAVGLLGGLALIAVISIGNARTRREVRTIVTQITPGMPFAVVTNRLGSAVQTFTTAAEIQAFGTRQAEHLVTNSLLHAFSHRGPPYRWILVYTDKEARKVLCADSKDL
jgi:hypothetical protein